MSRRTRLWFALALSVIVVVLSVLTGASVTITTGDVTAAGAELAIVDTSVDGHAALAAIARDAGMEVVTVSSVEELTAGLDGRNNLTAIHLLSHGSVGQAHIGDDTLSAQTLDQYPEALAAIEHSLSPDGDLLLYGCYVGLDGSGSVFLDEMTTAIDADVAASTDLTGAAALNGDWDLEAETGEVAVSHLDAQGSYDGLLLDDYTKQAAGSSALSGFANSRLAVNDYRATLAIDADVDGDTDFVVADTGSGWNLLENDGSGGFTEDTGTTIDLSTDNPEEFVVADYDNDGDDDIIDPLAGSENEAAILRNDGGTFTKLAAGSSPLSGFGNSRLAISGVREIFALDYDDDGDTDFVVADTGSGWHLLENDGSGGFSEDTGTTFALAGDKDAKEFVVADYDNDGDDDIIEPTAGAESEAKILRNDGGTFTELAAGSSPLSGFGNSRLSVGGVRQILPLDADADGDTDFVVADTGSGWHLLRNDGSGSFTEDTGSSFDLTLANIIHFLAVDFDADGDDDVIDPLAGGENEAAILENQNKPPSLSSSTPSDGATDFPSSDDIALTFDETMSLGTGDVVVRRVSDDTAVATADVSSSTVTVDGSQVTVDPGSDLPTGVALYVHVEPGALTDTDGEVPFALIDDPETVNFEAVAGNDAPTFDGGSSNALTVDEDASATDIGSLLTASDTDSSTLTWSVESAPSHGSISGLSTSESAGSSVSPSGVAYTPDDDYSGSDSFDIAVSDGDDSATITIDVTVREAPEVASISRGIPATQDTSTDSVTYDVQFSEDVSGVDSSDFTTTVLSGTPGESITGVGDAGDADGSTYTVEVSASSSGAGEIRLDVVDDDTITNGNGVELGGVGTSGAGDGSYTSGETYRVDNARPTFRTGSSDSVSKAEMTTGLALDIDAADDPGTTYDTDVTYSLGGVDATVFSIDTNTGELSVDSALDFENPTDADANNEYELTVTATDDVGNTQTQSVTVSITNANDAPTLDTNEGVTVLEGSTANEISAADLAATDPEQTSGSITYDVTTGVSAGTLFVDGSTGGTDDGTLDGESPLGTGTFTQADINSANLLYSHDGSETAADSFVFDLDDGAGGTETGHTFSITVDGVNDAPTLTVDANDATFTEDGSPATVFSSANADTIESGQQISTLTVQVENVTDSPDEVVVIDGSGVALTDGNSVTTANNALSAAVSLTGDTATVTVSGAMTSTTANTVVDTLGYENGDDPTTGENRTITLTRITDDGPTSNGGSNTTTLSESASVSVTAVNDAPTLSTDGRSLNPITEDDTDNSGTTVGSVLASAGTTGDVEGDTIGIAVTNVDNTDGTWAYSIDGGTTWQAFSDTSPTNSVLLASTDRLRFVPNADFSGIAGGSLTVRAWDGASGASGATADTTSNGGTTAYSAANTSVGVTVTAVNDAPTASGDSSRNTTEDSVLSVADDASADLLVLSSDPDTGDSLSVDAIDGMSVSDGSTVTLDSGATVTVNSDGSWSYDPNGQFEFLASGDNTTDSFTYTVVDESGSSDQGTITVTLTGVNDAPGTPSDGDGNANTVAESATIGDTVGITADSTDPDTGDSVGFSLTANAGGRFQINSSTGVVTVADASGLNYESGADYRITVQASDGTLDSTTNFTVTVSDADERPSFTSGASASLAEDATSGVAVVDVNASVPGGSADQSVSYALSAGNTGGAFEIDPANGTITVSDASQFDYEGGPSSFALTVEASEGTQTATQSVTVTITDVNETPSFTSRTSAALAEDATNGIAVVDVNASVPGGSADQSVSYALSAGNTGGAFEIDPANGTITVSDASQFDFEGGPSSYTLTVEANEGGETVTQDVTVTITDVDERPTITSTKSASLAEDTSNGTSVIDVNANVSGGSVDQSVSYAIAAGNTGGAFEIDPTSGAITVSDTSQFDYEGGPSNFTLTVEASEGAQTATQDVTVSITDVDERPNFFSETSASVAESSANGVSVLDVNANVPGGSADQSVSYAITVGNNEGAFSIDSANGTITVSDTSQFDYEGGPSSFTLTVEASEGSQATTQSVTLTIADVDERPSFTSETAASLAENAANGTSVIDVDANVPGGSADESVSYTITAGNNEGAFEIDSTNGTITVSDGSQFDYEGGPSSFTLTVEASEGGQITTQNVTITISDVDERPAITSGTSASIAESSANGVSVIDVNATVGGNDDEEVSYAISSGNTGSAFSIDAESGVVTVSDTTKLATVSSFTLTIEASEGGQTNAQGISITVRDITDPVSDAGTSQTVDEDSVVNFDGTGSTDNVAIASYEWDFGDGSGTSTTATPTHTFTDPGTYTVTLTVTDAAENSDSDTLTVTVSDTTSPNANAGTNQTVNEDTAVNFDGTSSTDNDEIASYEWNFGDGSAGVTGAMPTHTFDQPGIYTVVLNVTDSAGHSSVDTVTVTVNDTTVPTADAGADQAVDEDTLVDFSGSESTDNGAIASYEWDFGDGSANAMGATPVHTFPDPGRYTVTVNVTDKAGNSASDTLVVTVNDTTPPTADIGENRTVAEDTTIPFDSSGSTDNVGITSYEWDFGDNSTATGVSLNHSFSNPGTYTVSLTTTDAAGNTDTATQMITVTDETAPDVSVNAWTYPRSQTAVRYAQTVEVNATVTDSASAVSNVSINASAISSRGDISLTNRPGTSWWTGTVVADKRVNGTFNLTITARDAAGNNNTTEQVSIVVDNTPPSADAGNNVSVRRGREVAFDATNSTDDLGIVSYDWEFGDEANTTASTALANHTYTTSGTYTARLTVTDVAGNTVNETVAVTVYRPPSSGGSTYSSDPSSDSSSSGGWLRVNVSSQNESANNRIDVSVSNARDDQPIVIQLEAPEANRSTTDPNTSAVTGDAPRNISVPAVQMNVSRGGDFTLNVTTEELESERDGTGADEDTTRGEVESTSSQTLAGLSPANRDFARKTGARPVGYVIVNHSISDDDIEDVTFTFRVRKAYLETTGADAQSISLYRDETTRWNQLPTSVVGEIDDYYLFTATSPGLSVFSIGSSTALFEVTDAQVTTSEVAADDSVAVTATVVNHGSVSGTYTARLTVDGEVVSTTDVEVPARDERKVTLTQQFSEPGAYRLAVANASAGEVRVESRGQQTAVEEKTPADPTAPNMWLFAVLGVVVAAVLFGWSRRRDDDEAEQ